MKIVHVCISAPWDEKYAYQENLLPHYHRLIGHNVTIIAPVFTKIGDYCNNRAPVGESYLSDGTRLVRLKPHVDNRFFLAHIPSVRGLKEAIVKEQPDLLFLHDVCCFDYRCIPAIKNNFPQMKIVADNHGDYVNSLHSPLTRFLHKRIYRDFLISKILPSVDCFYGVTPSRCTFLNEVYGIPKDKIKLLIMGADNDKMMLNQRERLREEVRNRYGIRKNDFLIVTGGKIDRFKNIHILAHAVNSLQLNNLKLLIFGTINEDIRPLFEAEKSDNILEIGWVNSDKVYELFYAGDLIVFPGLHSVLWEQAIASKTPCAFTDIDGFRHVLFNNNCVLMTNNTEEYYKQLIEDLLDNPHKYEELKKNSDNEMTEKFYYSNIAKQVLQDVNLA